MSLYRVGRKICSFIFNLYFKIKVSGLENIKFLDDGAVLICNHVSNLDPILLGIFFKRRLFFMAKKELFSVPILGAIIKKLGAFSVDRNNKDLSAIETAVEIVKSGKVVAIFPQGHRSKQIESLKPKTGFVRIALQSKAKVILASICYEGFWPRSRVYLNFGQVLDLEEYVDEEDFGDFKNVKNLSLKIWDYVLELYSKK